MDGGYESREVIVRREEETLGKETRIMELSSECPLYLDSIFCLQFGGFSSEIFVGDIFYGFNWATYTSNPIIYMTYLFMLFPDFLHVLVVGCFRLNISLD